MIKWVIFTNLELTHQMNYHLLFIMFFNPLFFNMKAMEWKYFENLVIFSCLNHVLLKFFQLHYWILNQNFHFIFYVLNCDPEGADSSFLRNSKIFFIHYYSIVYNLVFICIIKFNHHRKSLFNNLLWNWDHF